MCCSVNRGRGHLKAKCTYFMEGFVCCNIHQLQSCKEAQRVATRSDRWSFPNPVLVCLDWEQTVWALPIWEHYHEALTNLVWVAHADDHGHLSVTQSIQTDLQSQALIRWSFIMPCSEHLIVFRIDGLHLPVRQELRPRHPYSPRYADARVQVGATSCCG